MKKTFLLFFFVLAMLTSFAQRTFFVGGTAEISYAGQFNLGLEPQVGYEITDRWAVGTGIGLTLASSGGYTAVLGVAEPFIRFCAWHNDRFFVDLKAIGGFIFDDELEICQVGLRPSLRFRINDHWDMSADIGLLGAQYVNYVGWTPAFGLSSASAGLWFAYRF